MRRVYAGVALAVPIALSVNDGVETLGDDDSGPWGVTGVRFNVGGLVPVARFSNGALRVAADIAWTPTPLYRNEGIATFSDEDVPVDIYGPSAWSARLGLSYATAL